MDTASLANIIKKNTTTCPHFGTKHSKPCLIVRAFPDKECAIQYPNYQNIHEYASMGIGFKRVGVETCLVEREKDIYYNEHQAFYFPTEFFSIAPVANSNTFKISFNSNDETKYFEIPCKTSSIRISDNGQFIFHPNTNRC